MKLLCQACLHALDEEGFCTNLRCARHPAFATGYTIEPPKLSETPDPFPQEPVAEVCCPHCGQAIPRP